MALEYRDTRDSISGNPKFQLSLSEKVCLIQNINLFPTFFFQFVFVPAVLDVKNSEKKRKHH